MDKQAYLNALRQAFLDVEVPDCERFLRQYSDHFNRRLADGCTEEEIASRLPNPVMIARRYACCHGARKSPPRRQVVTKLCLADAAVILLLILSLACIAALFGLTGVFAVFSVRLILGVGRTPVFEQLPYWGALLLGVACLGIGVLCAMGALLGVFFCRRGVRDYVCWHRHFLNTPFGPLPPIHPVIGEKKRRRLRIAAKSAAIVSGLALIAAFVLLSAYTGYHPFWKDFGWF